MKQHIQYQINTVACDISVAEVPSQPSNCPSTIEILGIQLQDVAIDTDLGSQSWVLGDPQTPDRWASGPPKKHRVLVGCRRSHRCSPRSANAARW